ncbi:uncharacterized protein LOC118477666 [Aplysia californica]|uniref:Uncharacterized protein LOC118477666 n=1 Tax=Aplysia californica TaxID=6500 RepID=A0ABM1VT52_APLCA|nr:uncharacterized protein LOC118477666 [Aplysia californica]
MVRGWGTGRVRGWVRVRSLLYCICWGSRALWKLLSNCMLILILLYLRRCIFYFLLSPLSAMPATKSHSRSESKRGRTSKSRKEALKKARAARQIEKVQDESSAEFQVAPPAVSTSGSPPPSSSSSSSSVPEAAPSLPVPSTPLSASSRKLAYNAERHSASSEFLGSTVVELATLRPLFENLLCPQCTTASLKLTCDSKKTSGLAVFLEIYCTTCEQAVAMNYTSGKTDKVFTVNRRVIVSSLVNGSGYAGLAKFCEAMDMPTVHHKTYLNHQKKIHQQSVASSDKILLDTRDAIARAYPEQEGNGVLDIDVSYDGSWHTRGHTSNSGVGCVIENRTGLVVDFQVLSKHCHKCKAVGAHLEGEAYERFWAAHKDECDRNHTGSSGSMEQKAAVMLWQRSEERGFRYRSVVCDGDTNTIKQINEVKPYADVTVEKKECVNHVAKRLGTALRKLVEDKKKVKVTLGGHGKGKLTQAKIGKLQKYYIRAVRSHSTVAEMKTAIWASFYHCSSTNTKPRHDDCPKGTQSWCFFQKARAKGLPHPDHDKHMSTFISEFVAEHMIPVYTRLTDDELLSRCTGGNTQNANESVHSVIWARCPKHVFVGRQRLEIAVGLGVGEFNQGARATHYFLQELGLTIGVNTRKCGGQRDSIRKRKAEKANESVAKRRRDIRRTAQLREEQRLIEAEGGEQYSAGGF